MANTLFASGATAGVTPFNLFGPYGVSGSGLPAPPFKAGDFHGQGDSGAEFQFAKLVLGAPTSLTDGQLYVLDVDFNATLCTTAGALRGMEVGVGRIAQANVPAGTYYLWLQRNGRAPVQVNASAPANTVMETTTTGGQANAAATPTTGTKQIAGMELTAANGGAAGTVQAFLRRPSVSITN